MCVQLCIEPADTDLSHANEAHSLMSPSSASVHLLTSLYDMGMTSSDRLQRRRPDTLAMDSDTSDCHDQLVSDMQLLGVDVRPTTTTLPDLVTSNDSVQPDATSRRRPVRSRRSAGGSGSDKIRRKTSSAMASSSSSVTASAVRTRLTCNSRSKRRARVHAVC